MRRGHWVVGALALLVSLGALAANADDKEKPKKSGEHAAHFDHCAKVCAECMVVCESNFQHCARLVADGRKEHERSMRLSIDCAELCATAGKLSGRKSLLSVPACEACAIGCEMCAAECEKHGDEHMKHCARACRECAKVCREMVRQAGHDHAEKAGKKG